MPEDTSALSQPARGNPGEAVLWTAGLLILIGFLALYTASALKAHELTGDHSFFLKKQAAALGCGLTLMFLFRWIPFSWIERLPLPLTIFSLLTLSLILIPHAYKEVGGALRWLNLGPVSFQPSEPAKLALVLFLAKNISRPSFKIKSLIGGSGSCLILPGLFCALLMVQPDFGTAVLLMLTCFIMMFIAGSSLKFNLASFALLSLLIAAALVSAPYRLRRITSFLDPWSDFKAGGFQIIQSYLGFQNGGLTGTGLGESRQKLFFLPEAHTDFIFSVIGEEMGFLGSALICLLFWNLLRLGIKIARMHTDPFKKNLALGITTLTGLQTIFNLGVVTGILPTKGIPLPLISNGLSSFVTYLFMLALLARLGQEVPIERYTPPPEKGF